MNKIYRLIWSQVLNTWVCCAENAKGRGKSGSPRKLIVGSMAFAGSALLATAALAAPTGGQVVSGSGGITQNGATTTITQSSTYLAVNWQSFNIAANETVIFLQPSTTAIAVNRIFSTNGSQILGNLIANRQIYLINPNGIIFGAGAQVNVGGMVASTLDVSSNNNGVISFAGSGTGSIVNQGRITAANGGYVAFIGNTVSNTGSIAANFGSVALGAGNAVTLTFAGNSLVQMQVDQSVLNSLANNGGLIQANGGMVILTAGARDALLASVVNNTGVIEAKTVQNQSGKIILLGGMSAGTVNVGGTLDASALSLPPSPLPLPAANGGFIESSAAHVHVADSAKVTTLAGNGLNGTWLIDPVDFTIAASGGDMTGAAVNAALAGGNFSIVSTNGAAGTAGNVNVNDTVSWSVNQLTLNAQNNININSAMNASGTASLTLLYGQGAVAAGNTSTVNVHAPVNLPSGNNFSTTQGSDGVAINYTVINSLGAAGSTTTTDLQGMNGNLAGNYALGSDIDASGTSIWNTNTGFTSLGNAATAFTGTFDGLSHTIINLTQNNSLNGSGLFGKIGAAGTVKNLGLTSVTIIKQGYGNNNYLIPFGALTGTNAGRVSNVYSTGTITNSGPDYNAFGGLVGVNTGLISNAYSSATLSSGMWGTSVGGLVGINSGTISNSYAAGTVTGTGRYVNVGGFVGQNTAGSIDNSYAIGDVTSGGTPALNTIGGLVGLMSGGAITNAYATGLITATKNGSNYGSGLIGSTLGGSISNSFWDTETTGRATSTGGIGLTTAQMQTQASFTPAGTGAGQWDFTPTGTWTIFEGQSNPLLRSFLTPLTVTANNATKTYDGLAYNGSAGVTYSVTPNMSNLLGTLSYGGTSQGSTNAGSYTITPGGLTTAPVQQGYIISYANGTLTVNAAPLTTTTTSTTVRAVSTTLESSFGGQSLGGQSASGNSSGSLSAMPGVSTTITLMQDNASSSATETAEEESPTGNSSPLGAASVLNTTLAFGTTGSLQIVNGGVNAPDSGMNVFLIRRDGN